MYDPESEEYSFIDTCYSTHHLQFAEDDNDTLWTSGGNDVVGWVDTKKYDETGDAAAAVGWAPLILDTNGNGKRDEWVEPGEPTDRNLDTRLSASFYSIMPNPADGSVWGVTSFNFPGAVIRLDPGSNPPDTALAEVYNIPLPGFSSLSSFSGRVSNTLSTMPKAMASSASRKVSRSMAFSISSRLRPVYFS